MPRIAILDANENGIRHLGYSLGELRQMTTAEVHDQGFEEGREERRRARETTDHLLFESVHIRKDCSRVPVELNTRLVEYGGRKVMQSFVRDLSGRKQTEEKLKTAQARAEKDDHARNALMIGNNRIMAMARVHEKLYGSTDLANIGAAEYLEGIVGSVMAGRSENHREVFCSFDIEDIILTGDQAIPCGLMVNELISNALKHGFSNRQSGEIEVSLHRLEDDRLELAVANDGESLPGDFDLKATPTLGMRLISAFATKLDGDVKVDSRKGTKFCITFPYLRS